MNIDLEQSVIEKIKVTVVSQELRSHIDRVGISLNKFKAQQ